MGETGDPLLLPLINGHRGVFAEVEPTQYVEAVFSFYLHCSSKYSFDTRVLVYLTKGRGKKHETNKNQKQEESLKVWENS